MAPLCRSSGRFSASRTAATMVAVLVSRRADKVMSTALESSLAATTTARARDTWARCSTSLRVASPSTAENPSALASSIDTGESSMTTILSLATPDSIRALAAARPFTPKPAITVWPSMRCLQRFSRHSARVRAVRTSIVVPIKATRKTMRSGVITNVFTSRAPSLYGEMSPYPVVESVTVE